MSNVLSKQESEFISALTLNEKSKIPFISMQEILEILSYGVKKMG